LFSVTDVTHYGIHGSLEETNSIKIFCGDVLNNHFINVPQNQKICIKSLQKISFWIRVY